MKTKSTYLWSHLVGTDTNRSVLHALENARKVCSIIGMELSLQFSIQNYGRQMQSMVSHIALTILHRCLLLDILKTMMCAEERQWQPLYQTTSLITSHWTAESLSIGLLKLFVISINLNKEWTRSINSDLAELIQWATRSTLMQLIKSERCKN